MLKLVKAVLLVFAFGVALVATAGDIEAGKQKAAVCARCHHVPQSYTGMVLVAKPEAYLVEQLQAFRSKERKNRVMNRITRRMSDEDIEDLAAFFSSLSFPKRDPADN